MKTEQEQINKLASTIFEIIGRENIDRFTEDKNGNLMSVETVGIEGIAKAIIQAGYGDVSEYKAEIRELKADLDHQIDATNDAENLAHHLQYDLDKAFERLKAQEREIKKLREENLDLKEELYELHDDLDIARTEKDKTIQQAKIDVLNRLYKKVVDFYDRPYSGDKFYCGEIIEKIDELIKEVNENDADKKTH